MEPEDMSLATGRFCPKVEFRTPIGVRSLTVTKVGPERPILCIFAPIAKPRGNLGYIRIVYRGEYFRKDAEKYAEWAGIPCVELPEGELPVPDQFDLPSYIG
jgi:hypothetical protein